LVTRKSCLADGNVGFHDATIGENDVITAVLFFVCLSDFVLHIWFHSPALEAFVPDLQRGRHLGFSLLKRPPRHVMTHLRNSDDKQQLNNHNK